MKRFIQSSSSYESALRESHEAGRFHTARVNRDPNYPSAMASHVRNDLRADIASDAYV